MNIYMSHTFLDIVNQESKPQQTMWDVSNLTTMKWWEMKKECQAVATAEAAALTSASESSPLIELALLLLGGLLLAGLEMALLIWRVLLGEARIICNNTSSMTYVSWSPLSSPIITVSTTCPLYRAHTTSIIWRCSHLDGSVSGGTSGSTYVSGGTSHFCPRSTY